MFEKTPSPKVSIIMPTYNRSGLIMETIESIRDQTYSNWELVIVDDGSDDNTEEIIAQLKDERIQFHKAGRTGIGGRIKNIGLRMAKGELIAFIDSDDLWATTKLEKQIEALKQYPEAGFCLTGGYNFREPGKPEAFFYKQTEGIKYDNIFLSFFESGLAIFTQALMLRRECLAVSGYFQDTRSFVDGDLDFMIKLARNFKAIILYEPLLFRRLHDANLTTLNWIRSHEEGITIISSYLDDKELPPNMVRNVLFRSHIHFGERCLVYKKRGKAIRSFLKAWQYKPLSIVPLKKTAKAVLYYLRGK
ncbi:MAG TPA: glycosyltransferase family 2 protein [Chitinophagaceae bacterium]|nr:glycosyltransferase family 2 protein [Chitinophagaceae bacterium]